MTTKTLEIKNKSSAADRRLIKALGHPLRDRILQALNESVASPAQLARALDEPLGNVSYHVKILLECEAVELVRTAPVRGAIEHFYRAIIRPYIDDENWARLPLSVRRGSDAQNAQAIAGDVAEALAGGGFDDPHSHISRAKLDLDEEAFNELAGDLERLVERALELAGEVANRDAGRSEAERSERAEHRTELAIMHFHRTAAGHRFKRYGLS